MKNNPAFTISFVIPTYNSAKTLEDCLASIRMQKYPQKFIEIILADGGSSDNTFEIAKKYKARVIHVESKKQGAEYNRASGALKARFQLLAFLDHDNRIPHKNWLRKMILPFVENKKIVGVETLRYEYDPKEKLLGRYFSLFGINDVVPFYLGKADRLAYIFDFPAEYGVFKKAKIEEKNTYYKIEFEQESIPTLGSNGFIVDKNILFKHSKSEPDNFFHIDVNVDLIRKGFNQYGFVKDVIFHGTNERGILDYLNRRMLFVKRYHVGFNSKRRFSVYEKKDLFRLIWFIFIAGTFLVPIIDCIKGYKKVKDTAWFIHPIITFLLMIVYSYTIASIKVSYYGNKLFQR